MCDVHLGNISSTKGPVIGLCESFVSVCINHRRHYYKRYTKVVHCSRHDLIFLCPYLYHLREGSSHRVRMSLGFMEGHSM